MYIKLNKDRMKERASTPGAAANLILFSNMSAIIPFPQQLRTLLSSMKSITYFSILENMTVSVIFQYWGNRPRNFGLAQILPTWQMSIFLSHMGSIPLH